MSVRVFDEYDGPVDARCEVIVVGSGPGGAVNAGRRKCRAPLIPGRATRRKMRLAPHFTSRGET